ncbi:hypothetical protein LINPERPRIM_LOCUS32708 [Linum perenne]
MSIPMDNILALVASPHLQSTNWAVDIRFPDIVNGFAFHPSLPMAVSSSVHCRFQVPDDEDANFQLTDDENCVSVWSFSCESTIKIGDIDKILAV